MTQSGVLITPKSCLMTNLVLLRVVATVGWVVCYGSPGAPTSSSACRADVPSATSEPRSPDPG